MFIKFEPLYRLYLLYIVTFNRWLTIKKKLVILNGEFIPGLSMDYNPKKKANAFKHHPCPFCLLHQLYGVKMKECKCYEH